MPPSPRAAILAVIRRIPCGRVASYGQVAALAGLAGHARQVGYTLHALPDGHRVPWHRVVNARGEIVVRDAAALPTLAPTRQRILLEAEGVGFDARGRVVMARYQWKARAGSGERERLGREQGTGNRERGTGNGRWGVPTFRGRTCLARGFRTRSHIGVIPRSSATILPADPDHGPEAVPAYRLPDT